MRRTNPRRSRAIDEPGDARLVEVQKRRQRQHGGLAVAEDSEQANLDQGEIMAGGDAGERALNGERELYETIRERQLGLRHRRPGVCSINSRPHQQLDTERSVVRPP